MPSVWKNRATDRPSFVVVDFSKVFQKWSNLYKDNEGPNSRDNIVARFLRFFPLKRVIETALAVHPENCSGNHCVWDAVFLNHSDIFDKVVTVPSTEDNDIITAIDFAIDLIIQDADAELTRILKQEGIDTTVPYLFEQWVTETSAILESAAIYN